MSEGKMLKITIDGREIEVLAGTSILKAAQANGISIPNLCYDERVEVYGACGLCLVEIEGSPKLARSCATNVRDGMIVHTHSMRVDRARKLALELLLSDHYGDCKAPCTKACPAGTDCQGYVGLVANGEYKEAVRVIKEKIPLPSSIGRICPHPCEKDCRRQFVDEPIAIAALKGFASDRDMESDSPYVPSVAPDTGKKAAVVGGGPGGLSAAYFLRRAGHAVTVYDAMPKMGGMLRYGIPEYRLPKAILDKEIEQIRALGITFRNEVKIGKDVTLDALRSEYDAVVLAAGAWSSTPMRVPNENAEGVWGGIDFLRAVATKKPVCVGDVAAVIGGGNTAMDASRTAVRLGAKKVYVIYRRTLAEMPAEAEEIEDAKSEGVEFKFLSSPAEFNTKDGKLCGVTLQKMRLGEPDAGGRRRPEPIPGETEYIDLDTAIMAIGQRPNLAGFESVQATKKGTVAADESTFRTSIDGVFAVGDMTNKGASIAVEAIGEAQKAAMVVDRYLHGENIGYKKPYYVERTLPQSYFDKYEKAERVKMPKRPADEAKSDFKEVALGLSDEAAQKEAMRCLECGCHYYFDCKLIKYANEYDIDPSRFTGIVHKREEIDPLGNITRDQNKCVLCGLCIRVCQEKMGNTVLGRLDRGFDTSIHAEYNLPLDDDKNCSMCGMCEAVCPTGALRIKQPNKKRLTVDANRKESVCTYCKGLCKIEAQYVGNTVLRVLPSGKQGILCKGGRFGFFAAAKKGKLPESADFGEVAARLTACPEKTAVIAGPMATMEELYFAKTHFDNVYIDADENAAAYAGAKYLGIAPVSEYKNEENVLLLNCLKPEGLSAAYTAAFAPLPVRGANSQIYTAPFTAQGGTYLTQTMQKTATAHPIISSVKPTLLAALGRIFGAEVSAESVLEDMKSKYDGLANLPENDGLDEKIITGGGLYASNRNVPEIEEFTK